MEEAEEVLAENAYIKMIKGDAANLAFGKESESSTGGGHQKFDRAPQKIPS